MSVKVTETSRVLDRRSVVDESVEVAELRATVWALRQRYETALEVLSCLRYRQAECPWCRQEIHSLDCRIVEVLGGPWRPGPG